MHVEILFFLVLVRFDIVRGQMCPDSLIQYEVYDTTYNQLDAGTAGRAYFMEHPAYRVLDSCTCGVLYKWKWWSKGTGAIQFQIWDRQNSQLYLVAGENYQTIPTGVTGNMEYYVPPNQRITVRNNYYLGWHALGEDIISYKTGSTDLPDELQREVMADLAVGQTHGWKSGTTETLENYAFALTAYVSESTAPKITNLPRTVIVYNTWIVGSLIYTLTADDIDPDDKSSLLVYTTTPLDPTGYFTFSRTTLEVRLLKSYPDRDDVTSPTRIEFTVQDQCGKTSTATLTIEIENWSPSLTSLPGFATISEDTTNVVVLHNVTFSDLDDATLTQTVVETPSSPNIETRHLGLDYSIRSIISVRGASYDYSTTQMFLINMNLSDSSGVDTNTGYFMLYITKNDPPKITNLGNGAHGTASYLHTVTDDVIYSVATTDADNDVLTFTFTCTPTPCPFSVNRDGVITATQDFFQQYVPGYDLEIQVADPRTTISTKWLSVIVNDMDDKPAITNLPIDHPIAIYEGTALGTSIYKVLYTDLDPDDTLTVQATFNPTWAANYFEMNISTPNILQSDNSSEFAASVVTEWNSMWPDLIMVHGKPQHPQGGVLSTARHVINYEALAGDTITVTVTVSDNEDSDSQDLILKMRNVNEVPSFHQSKYTLEPNEEGSAGATAGTVGFHIFDEDLLVVALNEVHVYSWDCGTNARYFNMDRATGAITYAMNFDYDTETVVSPYTCTVTITDTGGLTATTSLEIDIQDDNDNGPVFSQSTFFIFQEPSLGDGRWVGQVSASDKDRSDKYNTIYYSINQNNQGTGCADKLSKSYLVVNTYGNIYVNESWTSPDFDYGMVHCFSVIAENSEDETGTRRSASATVSLYLSGTTTSSTSTTDRPVAFISDTRNVAWVVVAAILAAAFLLLVVCLALAYSMQVKRYRWCIPSCRRWLLNLQKQTEREKQLYYLEILRNEEDEREGRSDSDDMSDQEDIPDADTPPPMWTKLQDVPQAASYMDPKPPLRRDLDQTRLKNVTGWK